MAKKFTDAEIYKLQLAAIMYDNQWSLIAPIEFPGRVPNSLNTAHGRIPEGWEPKKDTEVSPLRIEVEPERVAQEVSAIIKKTKKNSSVNMPVSLKRFLAGQDKKVVAVSREQTQEEREEWLRYKTVELEKANKELRLKVGSQQELASELSAAVRAADPFPRYAYAKPQASKSPVVPVIMLSDWHIGEVVDKEEVEGFNEYNYQIAQDRIFGIVDSFLKWCDTQRKVYRMDETVIFGLGDWVSGNIHAELIATNEFPLPVQTAKAGLLLGEVFCRISSHFNKLKVYEVGADNHGRLQPKPQAKQKALNSMSFLVHTIANQYCEKQGNIEVVTSKGIKLVAEVAGSKFLLEHGDTCKSWMGIPYYGVNREKGREAIKRMNTSESFNFSAMGHFHVPGFIEGSTLMNGSLSGTTEFDHSVGRFSPPSQLAFMVHPAHKIFNIVPFGSDH